MLGVGLNLWNAALSGGDTLPLFYQVGSTYWPAYKSAYLDGLATKTDLSTASRSNMGADLSGTNKFIGGTLGPDGKIYGMPYDSTTILIIDPVAGTASRSNMGADLSGTSKFAGGTLGPDGKIYGMPRDSATILIIDPVAGTASRSNMGADLSGTNKFIGGTLGPDGKIYGMPVNSTTILTIGNGDVGPLQAVLSGWINKL